MEAVDRPLVAVGRGWQNETYLDRELRVVAFHDPPYMFVEQHADGSFSYGGFLYELWVLMAAQLGIRYRLVAAPDGSYGTMDANGTWHGIVGELAHGRADVALTWLFPGANRSTVVDFVSAAPVDRFHAGLFVRGGAPDTLWVSLRSLLRPLGADVWWLLLGSVLALSAALRLTLVLAGPAAESRRTVSELGWGSCLMASLMAVLGQGWARTPDSLAARSVTLCCWTLGLLVYSSYTATLVSHLTTSGRQLPITTLREFFEQPGWRLATQPGSSFEYYWKISTDPYQRKLYQRTQTGNFININNDRKTLRDELLQRKVMILTDRKHIYRLLGQNACDLEMIANQLPKKAVEGYGYLTIAKGQDDLAKAIGSKLRKVNEAGILGRLRKTWTEVDIEVCGLSQQYRPLTFTNLTAVLAIVPLAAIVGVCLLSAETLACRVQVARRRRIPLRKVLSPFTVLDAESQMPGHSCRRQPGAGQSAEAAEQQQQWQTLLLRDLQTRLACLTGAQRRQLRADIDAAFDQ